MDMKEGAYGRTAKGILVVDHCAVSRVSPAGSAGKEPNGMPALRRLSCAGANFAVPRVQAASRIGEAAAYGFHSAGDPVCALWLVSVQSWRDLMLITAIRRVKRIVYGLIVLYILLELSSFAPPNLAILGYFILLLYFILGVTLIALTLKAEVEGRLKVLLLFTGFSSLVFSVSVLNGFLAVSGFYTFPEVLYFITVLVPLILFLIGALVSIVLLRKLTAQPAY